MQTLHCNWLDAPAPRKATQQTARTLARKHDNELLLEERVDLRDRLFTRAARNGQRAATGKANQHAGDPSASAPALRAQRHTQPVESLLWCHPESDKRRAHR